MEGPLVKHNQMAQSRQYDMTWEAYVEMLHDVFDVVLL